MIDTSKIYTSKNYGKFKIVKYKTAKNILIEFIDTGYITKTKAQYIRNGSVKDLLLPTVCGVGFIGDGEHKSMANSVIFAKYKAWSHMMTRCYCPKYHKIQPTYINCTVDPIWHNYQNFATWYDENYIDGYQLDKDKLQENIESKVYSPKTCVFISKAENSQISNSKTYTFKSPLGVIHNIFNLTRFCKEYGLGQPSMSAVSLGKRNHHKGWTNA